MIALQACINHAAAGYHVPRSAIETVLEAHHAPDGVGVMGIPPTWLPTLARYGFNVGKVLAYSCENIDAAAWIIAINPRSTVSRDAPAEPEQYQSSLPACAIRAAITYSVPEDSIASVLKAPHKAGTYGPLGIPAAWMPLLTAYGFNTYLVENDNCSGWVAGIWILGVERLNGDGFVSTESETAINYSSMPPPELIPLYQRAAAKFSVPLELLYAVSAQESGFNKEATSSAGAMGLMQLMPGTAGHYRVTNAYNPAQNIMGGANYLADLEAQFGGNLPLVLAAYNAGSGAVTAYGDKIPPFAETQNYVPAVIGRMNYYDRMLAAKNR